MSRLSKYIQATAGEMKHVKWPTTKQAMVYTILVIAISTLVAFYIAGFDYIFNSLLNKIV